MQVISIAETVHGEPSAILVTFVKLPLVIKICVLYFLSGRFTHVLMYFCLCSMIVVFLRLINLVLKENI